MRLLTVDSQSLIEGPRQHQYSRVRTRLQTQDGVRGGGVVLFPWNPASQTLTVHHIHIIRGDQVIDALQGRDFEVIRREENLLEATLDGVLTAVLQPDDLRVGDILDVAATLTYQDPSLQGHVSSILSSNVGVPIQSLRYRVTWPRDRNLRVLATDPWTQPSVRTEGGQRVVELTGTDLRPLEAPDMAPPRFGMQREFLISDFQNWGEVSALMVPLYERTSQLEPDSPLHAEIARIAAENPDSRGRTLAALRLVQDNVRYVALTMGDGNYVPAMADETWRRRFGDCKAMTALLLAILRELDVPAVASMVSSDRGDGLNERLPMLAAFDHVLVRVEVDGQVYLIDGTRQGDRTLQDPAVDLFKWTLPVRAEGADLERVVQPQVTTPDVGLTMTIDASAGLDVPAKVTAVMTVNGQLGRTIDAALALMSEDEREQSLRRLWQGYDSLVAVDEVTGGVDPETGLFQSQATGTSLQTWQGVVGTRRRLTLPALSVSYSAPEERDDEDERDIPYAITFPFLQQNEVMVILPNGGTGFSFEGDDIERELAGRRFVRHTSIEGDRAVGHASQRSLRSEISADEMERDRERAKTMSDAAVVLLAPADYQPTAGDRASLAAELTDVPALLRRARLLIGQGDLDRAGSVLDRAVELDGDGTEALSQRAEYRMQRGDFAAARQDFEQVREKDADDAITAFQLGQLALYMGEPEDALIEFTAVSRSPEYRGFGLRQRGAVYEALGRRDRALTDYNAAARDGDEVARSRAWLLRASQEDAATVRTEIAAKLAEDAKDLLALATLMRLDQLDGRPQATLPALNAALEADADNEDLLSMRGGLKGRLGDVDGAMEDLTFLREDAAGDPVILNSLCWNMAENGYALEQALAYCDEALASSPMAGSILDSRALVLLHLGRFDEALADYERVLSMDATIVPSRYGRGLARLALGDEGGREDLERARLIDPQVGQSFEVYERTRREP